VTTCEKGHGRIEIRKLCSSDALNGHVQFPHVQRVFQIERIRTTVKTGETSTTVEYGVTSLTMEKADDERLLQIVRDHWTIENKVHYVRDMAFDEDRSQIRTKNGPRVMATIRNIAMNILRILGITDITATLRKNALNQSRIFEMLALA
jgi:predicted transposase YbfD/YdcC